MRWGVRNNKKSGKGRLHKIKKKIADWDEKRMAKYAAKRQQKIKEVEDDIRRRRKSKYVSKIDWDDRKNKVRITTTDGDVFWQY